MKVKALKAVSLALVMLFTLAAPVLADSARGALVNQGYEPSATGTYALRTTHDNFVKVTVSAKGLNSTATYDVSLWNQYSGFFTVTSKTPDSRGNLRVSFTANYTGWYDGQTHTFTVNVLYHDDSIGPLSTSNIELSF